MQEVQREYVSCASKFEVLSLTSSPVGHFSRDCPQGGGGRSCHNCGEEGHMSKDCPNEKKLICRNCDEEGHLSKECPKPRDCKWLSL